MESVLVTLLTEIGFSGQSLILDHAYRTRFGFATCVSETFRSARLLRRAQAAFRVLPSDNQ
jgi:hypothetical protein